MPEKGRFLRTLCALRDDGVDFIVVGGLAAVLDGAPINTFDVDVVHSRNEKNIGCLLKVLEALDAVCRPNASHLASAGDQNLITRYGPLDLLGTIGRNLGYQDLLPHSVEMDVGEGVLVKVLDLETLIAIKEELGGEKDRASCRCCGGRSRNEEEPESSHGWTQIQAKTRELSACIRGQVFKFAAQQTANQSFRSARRANARAGLR